LHDVSPLKTGLVENNDDSCFRHFPAKTFSQRVLTIRAFVNGKLKHKLLFYNSLFLFIGFLENLYLAQA